MNNDWFSLWPDGLISISNTGIIARVSPMAEEILGWQNNTLEGKNIHEILCAQNRAHAHSLENCPLLALEPHSEIFSMLWKSHVGSYVSVDCRVLQIEHSGASRIISFVNNEDRLHNQAELQKFAEYVDNNPAPVAEFDAAGQLLFGNAALQQLMMHYGFSDQGHAFIFPAELGALCQEMSNDDINDKHLELRIDTHCFMWHFHLLKSENEKTIMGYAFNISEQKRLEKVAEEQRTNARKEFYAKMVHELRTPLNAIIGFSEILLTRDNSHLKDRERDHIKMISSAGNQLNQLVTDTLDLAKIESGKMQLHIDEFSVNEVCDQIHDQIQTLASKKSLNFRYSTLTEQRVFSDKTKVRQILINLLSNAIKYTKEGSVHLLVSIKEHAELGACVSISVSDTGIGIPEDQINKLFADYEQIEEKQNKNIEGTGLGLALVNNLVYLLGGRIIVSSVYGTGSTFEVLLPYYFRGSDSDSE